MRSTVRRSALSFKASTPTLRAVNVRAVRVHMNWRRDGVNIETERVRVEAKDPDVEEGRRERRCGARERRDEGARTLRRDSIGVDAMSELGLG
jgi:hypothetical protein